LSLLGYFANSLRRPKVEVGVDAFVSAERLGVTASPRVVVTFVVDLDLPTSSPRFSKKNFFFEKIFVKKI